MSCFGKTELVASLSFETTHPSLAATGRTAQNGVAIFYDRRGREVVRFRSNGMVLDTLRRLQRLETSYDLIGRVAQTRLFEQGRSTTPTTVYDRRYDAQSRLSEILDGTGRQIGAWEYHPTGSLQRLRLGEGELRVDYRWTLHGALEEVSAQSAETGDTLFLERLSYDHCDSEIPGCVPQYSGNISAAAIRQLVSATDAQEHEYAYLYDMLGRLTEVQDDKGIDYDALYTYDLQGRMQSQALGGGTAAVYHYTPGTNRLSHLSGSLTIPAVADYSRDLSATGSLRYDSAGALIYDRSKQMTISRDDFGREQSVSRVVPSGIEKTWFYYSADGARVSRVTADPYTGLVYVIGEGAIDADFATTSDACGALQSMESRLPTDGQVVLLNSLSDAGNTTHAPGNCLTGRSVVERKISASALAADIDYQSRSFTVATATHYSLLGGEVRESASGSDKFVRYLPEGLGRVSPDDEDVLEYAIKDHLGNTRMNLAATSVPNFGTSIVQSYDYYAYGFQVKLADGAYKLTETFTGKELDEQTGLYYFGARYYDPELAVWISPDPARQFASPYLYTGNGYNPISGVDADGNDFIEMNFIYTHPTSRSTVAQGIVSYYSGTSANRGDLLGEWVAGSGGANLGDGKIADAMKPGLYYIDPKSKVSTNRGGGWGDWAFPFLDKNDERITRNGGGLFFHDGDGDGWTHGCVEVVPEFSTDNFAPTGNPVGLIESSTDLRIPVEIVSE